jgi:hypothetical protein
MLHSLPRRFSAGIKKYQNRALAKSPRLNSLSNKQFSSYNLNYAYLYPQDKASASKIKISLYIQVLTATGATHCHGFKKRGNRGKAWQLIH